MVGSTDCKFVGESFGGSIPPSPTIIVGSRGIMNKILEDLARDKLKELLSQCTEEQKGMFKRIYARTSHNAGVVIDIVIDEIDVEKLDCALSLVLRTLDKNKKVKA